LADAEVDADGDSAVSVLIVTEAVRLEVEVVKLEVAVGETSDVGDCTRAVAGAPVEAAAVSSGGLDAAVAVLVTAVAAACLLSVSYSFRHDLLCCSRYVAIEGRPTGGNCRMATAAVVDAAAAGRRGFRAKDAPLLVVASGGAPVADNNDALSGILPDRLSR